MQDLIARLRAGTVTPADLDAAAEALEKADALAKTCRHEINVYLGGPEEVNAAMDATDAALTAWEALK